MLLLLRTLGSSETIFYAGQINYRVQNMRVVSGLGGLRISGFIGVALNWGYKLCNCYLRPGEIY